MATSRPETGMGMRMEMKMNNFAGDGHDKWPWNANGPGRFMRFIRVSWAALYGLGTLYIVRFKILLTDCRQQHVVQQQGDGNDDQDKAIGATPADHPWLCRRPVSRGTWILLPVLIRRRLSTCHHLSCPIGWRWHWRRLLMQLLLLLLLLAQSHDAAWVLFHAILLLLLLLLGIVVQLLLEGILAGCVAVYGEWCGLIGCPRWCCCFHWLLLLLLCWVFACAIVARISRWLHCVASRCLLRERGG